jgi:phage head maturation protease
MRRSREIEVRQCEGGFVPFFLPSCDLGGFAEVFLPSAFKKTLQESRGLHALTERDGIRLPGRSIVFQVIRARWRVTDGGLVIRELLEVRLLAIPRSTTAVHISRLAREMCGNMKRLRVTEVAA